MSDFTYVLGAKVQKLIVRMYRDSSFGTSITAPGPWGVAPRLVFSDDPENVWESTIDPENPNRVIFTATPEQVNEHYDGEKVELYEGDAVKWSGQVILKDSL